MHRKRINMFDVRREIGAKRIEMQMVKEQLMWIGHVMRRRDSDWAKASIMGWTADGEDNNKTGNSSLQAIDPPITAVTQVTNNYPEPTMGLSSDRVILELQELPVMGKASGIGAGKKKTGDKASLIGNSF